MLKTTDIALFFSLNRVNIFKNLNCSKEILVLMIAGAVFLVPSFSDLRGQKIENYSAADDLCRIAQKEIAEKLPIFQNDTLIPVANPVSPSPKVVWRFKTIITGYSSTPEQTDETPFITASGKKVREGIVAANFVPLGTKLRLPELFGDKVFLVEDRMHPRKYYLVDIWFSNKKEALEFGAKTTMVEVLQD